MTVPVTVRLGILTLFPLLESLRSVKEIKYDKLCRQILSLLDEMMRSLPPLALQKEPSDCIKAFQTFIYNLIKDNEFKINSEEQIQAIKSFIGLSIAHGSISDLLLIIDVLFNIHKHDSSPNLKINNYLKQLSEYRKLSNLPILVEGASTGAWTINQVILDNNNPNDFTNKLDCICSDGSFLYFQSHKQGLRKIGTGYNNTLKGYVYNRSTDYRVNDYPKALLSLHNKLYYLISTSSSPFPPSAVPSSNTASLSASSLVNTMVNQILAEPMEEEEEEESSVNISVINNEEELSNRRIQLAVINPETLKEEGIISLIPSSSTSDSSVVQVKHQICVDGNYLYTVGKKSLTKSSSTSSDSNNEEYIVDVYDLVNLVNNEATPVKSIKLSNLSSKGKINNIVIEYLSFFLIEPALQFQQWEKGSFYCNGYYLAVLLSVDSVYSKTRLFSLLDGKHVADVKMVSQPQNCSVYYDAIKNMFWTYSDNRIESWKNLSLGSKLDDKNTSIYPSLSPESILTSVSTILNKSTITPLDSILTIVASIDRLSRQHPIYNDSKTYHSKIVPRSSYLKDYVYSVELNNQLFTLISSISSHVLTMNLEDDLKSYLLLTLLRILKVNIYEYSVNEKELKEDKLDLVNLRTLLYSFIENSKSIAILQESCNVLSIGFTLFYPSSLEQKSILLSLLESSTVNQGSKTLLETLLAQISCYESIGDALLGGGLSDSTNSNNNDAMDIDNSSKSVSFKLITALLEYSYQEGAREIELALSNPEKPVNSPLVTPVLKVLMGLQRDLLSNVEYKNYLFEYVTSLINKCKLFIDSLLNKKIQLTNSLEQLLRSTMLGILMPNIAIGLHKPSYISSTSTGQLIPPLLKLVHSLDILSKQSQSVLDADKSYLKNLSNKPVTKKHYVESKHPYPQGKNQLKQTISIPGSQALCVYFDARSRTVNSSSDLLQFYRGSTVNDPIVLAKDNKTMFYSGNNFPKEPVIVPGDTVTIVFSANTRLDPKNAENLKYRWGFKCKITQFVPTDKYQPVFQNWLLYLENSLTLLSTKLSSTLTESFPLSDKEKKIMPLLNSPLFKGGLQEQSIIATSLQDFIDGKESTNNFYNWLSSIVRKPGLSLNAKKPLEIVERNILAFMLHHFQLVHLLNVNDYSTIKSPEKDCLILLLQETNKVITLLQQKGQVENLWRVSVQEKPTLDSFVSNWREEKKEKLLEVCELKNVQFIPSEEQSTIEKLYQRLQEDIKLNITEDKNSYELVSLPVLERVRLFLKLKPSEKLNFKNFTTDTQTLQKRVKELRKWIQIYSANSKPNKVEGGVQTTSKSLVLKTLSTSELMTIFSTHNNRAKLRMQGFKYYYELFEIASFSSTRHQILCSLGIPFTNGGHYLQYIPLCGQDLTGQVTESFVLVFNQICKIMKEKSIDPYSKLLSLVITALSYQDFDIPLLQSQNIFANLSSIVDDCNLKLQQSKTRIVSKHKQQQQQQQQQYDKAELDQIELLRKSSWTSFKLLAICCITWNTEASSLQDQIFQLICSQLNTISQQIQGKTTEQQQQQIFELLSLLCLLADSPATQSTLAKQDNLMNLLSILKSTIEPRSKKLALRLCTRLLPLQPLENPSKLIELFLEEIGSRIPYQLQKLPQSSLMVEEETIIEEEEQEDNEEDNIEEEEDEEDEEDEDDEDDEEDSLDDLHSIYLASWTLGHLRLIELCQNSLGQDFFQSTTTSLPSGTTPLDRQGIESKVQQLLQEMNDEGHVLLKTTTLANCNLLSQNICSLGGSVIISESSSSTSSTSASSTLGGEKDNTASARNNAKVTQRRHTAYWINGSVALSLASEYIYLLRLLLDAKKSNPQWKLPIQNALLSNIHDISNLQTQLSQNSPLPTDKIHQILGTLAVLGGFTEILRLDGKVRIEEFGETKEGIIVDINHPLNNISVIFDYDRTKSTRNLSLTNLKYKAIPKIDISTSTLQLTSEQLYSLFTLLQFNAQSIQTSLDKSWLYFELKHRSLQVLAKFFENNEISSSFLSLLDSKNMELLLKNAGESKPFSRIDLLEKDNSTLEQIIWDLTSQPNIDNNSIKIKKAGDIIPHQFKSIHTLDIVVPTGFSTNEKLNGILYRGSQKRKVEFVGVESNPLTSSRRSYMSRAPPAPSEIIILANAPIVSDQMKEFYFEVTIDQTESNGSLLSVGLAPDMSKTWGNNSYRYQANAKKTTFVSGNRRQNDYGTPFRAKNIIGCGWNKEDKIIYFTKDGVDLGPAFTNISFNKLYPAIGLSKGVHMSINFGQEPFRFKFAPEGETEEEREQRKREEEEKRKKAKEYEIARRKKEKEDERQANILAAQPLLSMGFELKMALVALRQTGYSGPEAASNWLLENVATWNWDDEVEDKEEEAPKDKEENKEATATNASVAVEAPSTSEDKTSNTSSSTLSNSTSSQDLQQLAIESYVTTTSKTYFLSDNFSFNEEETRSEKDNKLMEEWEAHVIPAIKTFMERDGFSNFEVEEYLQQIRTQLIANNEQQARGIVMQILGDAGLNIQFPSVTANNKVEKQPLKLEEIKVNNYVQIIKPNTSDAKHWLPKMESTVGRIGLVKSVDYSSALVLVEFYDQECGKLMSWWYTAKDLLKPEELSKSSNNITSKKDTISLQQSLLSTQKEISSIYARRVLLALLPNIKLSLNVEDTYSIANILSIIASEPYSLATNLVNFLSEDIDLSSLSKLQETLISKLRSIQKESQPQLIDILAKTSIKLLDTCTLSEKSSLITVSSSKPSETQMQQYTIENSSSLLVIFERSTFLPPSTYLEFYLDSDSSQLIKSYSDKSKLLPFIVPSNSVWFNLQCQSAQRNNVKFKFDIIPIHTNYIQSFWIIQYLLNYNANNATLKSILPELFNSILYYIYSSKSPSILKESAIYLLLQIVHSTKGSQVELPYSQLEKLKEEMIQLFEIEKKRENNIHSSYLQSIIELFIAVKECGGNSLFNGLFEQDSIVPMDIDKKSTESNIQKTDETLNIAIALANSIKSVEIQKKDQDPDISDIVVEEQEEEEEEPMDEELATAMALSLSSNNADTAPASTSTEEKPKEETIKVEESEEDIFEEDDEMDEDMKAALELSMQKPEEQSQSVPPPPPPSSTAPIAKTESSKTELKTSGTASTVEPPKPPPQPLVQIPWFKDLLKFKNFATGLLDKNSSSLLLKDIATSIWKSTRKDRVKERILLVDNLPMFDFDKRDELESIIKRSISDLSAKINFLFVPYDETSKQLKGYCFIEVVSTLKVEAVLKKLHRHKLKLPNIVEEPTNLKASLRASASLPRGTVKVYRLVDLEKSSTSDPRVFEFYQSKLIVDSTQLTSNCKNALLSIFKDFGGEQEEALNSTQLNQLQIASNGRPLTKEQLDYAFDNYSTKTCGPTQERALTLKGFLDLYTKQCIEAPLDTWQELEKLGFDFNLLPNSYLTIENAYNTLVHWNNDQDIELLNYVEQLYSECEVSSPLQLIMDQIIPHEQSISYPLLAKLPLPSIRFRFEVIKQFNLLLSQVFSLINFDRQESSYTLGSMIIQLKNIIFHSVKMEFFFTVLDKTSFTGNQPTVNIDRLKLAAKKDKKSIESLSISNLSHTMFGIAFNQLQNISSVQLRQKKPPGAEPHFAIKIVFKGENVQGDGGPYRQFFTDVSKELQGVLPLFIPCPNAQQIEGENRDKFIINPSLQTSNDITLFEFVGKLMGLAIRTGVLLTLDLPTTFWKPLVGNKVNLEDMKLIDKSLYTTIKFLTNSTKEEFEEGCIDHSFTTRLSDKSEITLIPEGESTKVSFENKQHYAKLIEKARLSENQIQLQAIKRGLISVIPFKLLNLLTWQDLEWKVCGKPFIDIHLLKRHTTCSGVQPDAPHINYFWNTLFEFNQQDRRGFLRFVWAQERLPVNDEEFERTKTRMMIKPFLGLLSDPNQAFPKADTCFFNVMLPEYTSQKILRDRLLFAIHTDSHRYSLLLVKIY